MVSKLRKSARDRDCEIRLPGICNRDNSTVTLCHLGGGGMGYKHSDIFGAYGCSACHDAVDGRAPCEIPAETLRLWHMDGMQRTQEIMLAEGLIRV